MNRVTVGIVRAVQSLVEYANNIMLPTKSRYFCNQRLFSSTTFPFLRLVALDKSRHTAPSFLYIATELRFGPWIL